MKKTKAIIVLPGFLGSRLFNYDKIVYDKKTYPTGSLVWIKPDIFDLFDGDLKNVIRLLALDNGQPLFPLAPQPPLKKEYGTLNTYSALIKSITSAFKNKFNIIFFSYDWRLSLKQSAALLNEYLKDSGFSEIVIVAHSMGGILGSYLISEYNPPVSQLITIGTPFLGSPKVLDVLLSGNALNFFIDLFISSDIKAVAGGFPTAFTMLPNNYFFNFTKPYLYDTVKKTPLSKKETDSLITAEFPQSALFLSEGTEIFDKILFSPDFVRTQKVYICGTQIETVQGYTLENGDLQTIKPVLTLDGDGTVPLPSANLAGFNKNSFIVKKAKHVELVKNGFVLKTLNSFIS